MNLHENVTKRSDVRKVYEKRHLKKSCEKRTTNLREKTYDILLAAVGKRQTCVKKFVRTSGTTYEIVDLIRTHLC